MRATVTIDDALFEEADRCAQKLGLSRSGFYQRAVERYVSELRARSLTEQMNRFVEQHGDAVDSRMADYVAEAWRRDMGRDDW